MADNQFPGFPGCPEHGYDCPVRDEARKDLLEMFRHALGQGEVCLEILLDPPRRPRKLTASLVRKRWVQEGLLALHRKCERSVSPETWLDYVRCPHCKAALSDESDVIWKRAR